LWLVAGWSLLALGLAIKITAAFLLVPLILVIQRGRRTPQVLAAFAALLPALLWYAWAHVLVIGGGGSRASADNQAIWLGLLHPSALWRRATWELIGRFVFLRAFTPLGVVLAVLGWLRAEEGRVGRPASPERVRSSQDGSSAGPDRLWQVWMVGAVATLALLAEKLHHEYYFLILAPAVAAGVGSALDRLIGDRRRSGLAAGMGLGLVLLCAFQARSTWQDPPEWTHLAEAAGVVATTVPHDAWLVAPEALLFQADRRGCRLEWTPNAVRRAAGEWGAERNVQSAFELVEYYQLQGARYFADLGAGADDGRRMALHEAVRRRYKVIVDDRQVLVAELVRTTVHGPWTH
jgi:4-amino-4-deoxy-L-arabinose transferase-like glycosyltransferase